jgi:hypothetical protein
MSVHGTERTWRSSRCMSVIGGTADDICSQRVFRLLSRQELGGSFSFFRLNAYLRGGPPGDGAIRKTPGRDK